MARKVIQESFKVSEIHLSEMELLVNTLRAQARRIIGQATQMRQEADSISAEADLIGTWIEAVKAGRHGPIANFKALK